MVLIAAQMDNSTDKEHHQAPSIFVWSSVNFAEQLLFISYSQIVESEVWNI